MFFVKFLQFETELNIETKSYFKIITILY